MGLIILTVFSLAVMPISAADQPFMEAAKKDLDEAMSYLKKADADKGGYRVKSMGYVREAIAQVNAGIAYDRKH